MQVNMWWLCNIVQKIYKKFTPTDLQCTEIREHLVNDVGFRLPDLTSLSDFKSPAHPPGLKLNLLHVFRHIIIVMHLNDMYRLHHP